MGFSVDSLKIIYEKQVPVRIRAVDQAVRTEELVCRISLGKAKGGHGSQVCYHFHLLDIWGASGLSKPSMRLPPLIGRAVRIRLLVFFFRPSSRLSSFIS